MWDDGDARGSSEEFFADDLEMSLRAERVGVDESILDDAAVPLWIMAVDVCRDAVPEDAIESGRTWPGRWYRDRREHTPAHTSRLPTSHAIPPSGGRPLDYTADRVMAYTMPVGGFCIALVAVWVATTAIWKWKGS